MQSYSEIIVNAMKYVDEQIMQIDSKSVNRERLHNKISTQITSKVKLLADLNDEIIRNR